jgi:lipoprotein-releasing system permease protein
MYKLFLCLRYLRSRVIAYFAVLGVALCVAMMLIATSVMNGFLDRIEKAAKGLFGDVIIEARTSTRGMGGYDEMIAAIHKNVPEVEAASPFILNYCFLQVPGDNWNTIVQAAGIRLPERAKATDFARGLFVQKDWPAPTFDPPIKDIAERLDAEVRRMTDIIRRYKAKAHLSEHEMQILDDVTLYRIKYQMDRQKLLDKTAPAQEKIARCQEQLDQAYAASRGEPTAATDALEKQLDELTTAAGYLGPRNHIILGLGIAGLILRTPEGETIRRIGPGDKIAVSIIPLGQLSAASSLSLNTQVFTIVDDCETDVSSIDSDIVYVPFETLQRLNGMEAKYDSAEPNRIAIPARCNQIHIKVRGNDLSEKYLETIRDKVEKVWQDFRNAHPELAVSDAAVQTWQQRQESIVGPIKKQRTLTVIMFGIISLVSVVLIFVIFYMIVFQKTKDIGVLKAVGASNSGVAGIFLAYGAAIGLVGSILGTIGGYYFVLYINEIQDAVDKWFGFRVWDREVFMFEKIPNEVQPISALLIVAGAIAAGLIGALIPAMRAARMQPVEALRYE